MKTATDTTGVAEFLLGQTDMKRAMKTKDLPNLPLGRLVATPGALELLEREEIAPSWLAAMHKCHVWGEMDDHDFNVNLEAVKHGNRVMSCYPIGDEKLWIITEWDRSVTTILLPSEY